MVSFLGYLLYFLSICGVVYVKLVIQVSVIEKIYLDLILSSSSNRKYQPFPLLSYFPCSMVCFKWLFHLMLSVSYIYIYIHTYICQESWVVFPYYYTVLWRVQIIEYIMARWYILSSVCLIFSQFSQLSLLWWLWEYMYFIYYYNQIGSMNHLPLFRVRSWNNGMRLMSSYVLIMTSWHGSTFCGKNPPFICGYPLEKRKVRGALGFPLLSSSRTTWTNSRLAGDMRRDGAHMTSL